MTASAEVNTTLMHNSFAAARHQMYQLTQPINGYYFYVKLMI